MTTVPALIVGGPHNGKRHVGANAPNGKLVLDVEPAAPCVGANVTTLRPRTTYRAYYFTAHGVPGACWVPDRWSEAEAKHFVAEEFGLDQG